MNSENTALLEIIQLHERMWGTENYPGRPTLSQLINAPVIVMWVDPPQGQVSGRFARQDDDAEGQRYKLAAYHTADEMNEALLGVLLLGKNTTNVGRRLARVYVGGKQVTIKSIHVTIEKS